MALCSQCGEVPTCPRCSVHPDLPQRQAGGSCAITAATPCPCRRSAPLRGPVPVRGQVSTQKLQEELQALYPDVEVMRMDADTITATRSHEVLLDRFRRKKVPILLGTQMVAKGLDFPNVTLVGVVDGRSLPLRRQLPGRRTDLLPAHPSGGPGRTRGTSRGGPSSRPGPRTTTSSTWLPARTMIPFTPGSGRCAACCAFRPFLNLFRITISGPEETQVLRACAVVRRSLDPWIKPRQHGPEGPEVRQPPRRPF
ncbi:MAG: helicase-related protein [Evtepia sp.]